MSQPLIAMTAYSGSGLDVLMPFALTLFAGLATGLGAAIAFLTKRTNYAMLSLTMGFAAGVMLYVSFVEIMVKARESLSMALGESFGAG